MPHIAVGPAAQELKQCQHCYKSENPPDFHLLSCSRCTRSHYCNRECQLADYPNHKAACRSNAAMLERLRGASEENKKAADHGGPSLKKIETRLKQWIQIHRPLLGLSITNALTLQRTPDRCRTDSLLLRLKINPSSKNPAQYFSVDSTLVASLDDHREVMGSEHQATITRILADSQALRDKGGVGFGIVFTSVPEVRMMHITPFGWPESLSELEVNKDWEANLKEMVRRGKTF